MPFKLPTVMFVVLLLWGCSPLGGIYHTVRPGQTLYQIGKTYGVDQRYLARINGIDDPSRLRVGQRLFIPGARHRRYVPSTVSSSPPPPAQPSRPRTRIARKVPPSPRVAREGPATGRQGAAVTRLGKKVGFIWPLKGKILRSFGTRGSAYRTGLEIAATRGEAVLSSAAGRVIYSGDGIRGYGNLIILRHDDSFYTVYGFNKKNLVSSGSYVSKGEKIALAGVPPDGGSPRLYFEIRHGKTAVDPIFYLP